MVESLTAGGLRLSHAVGIGEALPCSESSNVRSGLEDSASGGGVGESPAWGTGEAAGSAPGTSTLLMMASDGQVAPVLFHFNCPLNYQGSLITTGALTQSALSTCGPLPAPSASSGPV